MKSFIFRNISLLTAALLLAPLLSGCGPKKPDQFPDVVPVSLTVLRDGKPVPNAKVSLNYASSVNSALVTGTTDEKGVCKFQTALVEYVADGAPVGSAKVTMAVELQQEVRQPTSQEDVAAVQAEQRKRQEEAGKILPPCLLTARDSTLIYEIPAEGGDFTVNLEEYDDVPVFVPPKGGKPVGPPR